MKKYVITCIVLDKNTTKFYTINGGSAWWSTDLYDARFFNTIDEAKEVLDGWEFTERRLMSDGSNDAPLMLRKGAELGISRRTATIRIQISEVKLDVNFSVDVDVYDLKPYHKIVNNYKLVE